MICILSKQTKYFLSFNFQSVYLVRFILSIHANSWSGSGSVSGFLARPRRSTLRLSAFLCWSWSFPVGPSWRTGTITPTPLPSPPFLPPHVPVVLAAWLGVRVRLLPTAAFLPSNFACRGLLGWVLTWAPNRNKRFSLVLKLRVNHLGLGGEP